MGDGTANVGFGLLDTRRGTAAPTTAPCCARWLDTFPAEEWQLGEEHAVTPAARRRPADGAAPRPRLHPRPAARRRRRRHGQPVQRRGHQLRDGDRPHGGRDRRRGAAPGRRAWPARRCCAATPSGCAPPTAATTGSASGFLALLARPDVVRFATAHGLKRPALVAAALRLMGNLTDGRDGDARRPRRRRPHPPGAGGLTWTPPGRHHSPAPCRHAPCNPFRLCRDRDRPHRRVPLMLSIYVPILGLFALAAAFALFSVAAAPFIGPAPVQPGQARRLRVRDRAGRPAAHRRPVPGQVLPDRDALHHLRHRDRLPLPVGRRTTTRWASSGWSRWSSSSPPSSSPTPTCGDAAGSTGTERRRPMGLEEKLPSGVLLTTVEKLVNWTRKSLAVAGDVRPGLLRHRDDGHRRRAATTWPASAWRSSAPRPGRPT